MKKNLLKIDEKIIFILLIINFVARLLVMLFTNLGNDEVYYVQYALNPDIGYFDHPPLVGLLIRLFTFNLHYIYNDFFIRLGSLVLGSINLYIVYKIGVLLKNRMLGLISTLLYSSSFYASILVGTFIMPDTPLSFFWLLAIFAFIKFIVNQNKCNYWLIVFGVSVGFGLASKYQAIFLWIGAIIYFLFYNRKVFLTPKFWLSVLLTVLIFSPVLNWNLTSEYSGIQYHSERVSSSSWIPTLDHFFPEFFGQIFYNNPFNVFLIVVSIIQLLKLKIKNVDKKIVFLFAISLPLIMLTLGISLYNKTLPHWSGPSYFSLIFIPGYCYLSCQINVNKKRFRNSIFLGTLLLNLIVIIGLFQINTGFLPLSNKTKMEEIGENDFVVDLGMWKEISKKIKSKIENDQLKNPSDKKSYILTHNWFPAAHIDYYYALPNNVKLFTIGNYKNQHEYLKLNKTRGKIPLHSNMYYITTSNYYKAPKQKLLNQFKNVDANVFPIKMRNKTMVNLFMWKLSDLEQELNLNTTKDTK